MTDAEKTIQVKDAVVEAIRSGAQDYLYHVNGIKDGEKGSDEDLHNVIKITQLVRSDLQRGVEFYDKLFQE